MRKRDKKMKESILYIHGKGGAAEEAEHYKPLFPDCEVIGFDYRSRTPWEARKEFPAFFAGQRQGCDRLTLIANSIGAFFAMSALDETLADRACFISPVVDMETLILSMMQGAHVTEEQLKAAGEIPTEMGETLSWPYLCWVREHPLLWHTPTQVLYGDKDALTSRAVMERFRRQSGAHLTIMEDGEHWFHTSVQMAAVQTWEEANL